MGFFAMVWNSWSAYANKTWCTFLDTVLAMPTCTTPYQWGRVLEGLPHRTPTNVLKKGVGVVTTGHLDMLFKVLPHSMVLNGRQQLCGPFLFKGWLRCRNSCTSSSDTCPPRLQQLLVCIPCHLPQCQGILTASATTT